MSTIIASSLYSTWERRRSFHEYALCFADVENQKIVTPNTVFEWGSVTKLLVWTSVMQLVEQGKLELDEDIRAHLPEGFLTKLQYDAPITMLNLMHHNAGWEEKFTDLFYKSANDIKTLEDTLRITEPYHRR